MRTRYPRLLNSLPLTCSLLFITASCSKHSDKTEADLFKEADALYKTYLTGDVTQARNSMEQSVVLVENGNLSMGGRAYCLFFDYIRLYAIEKQAGNEDLADAYLTKARYWFLTQYELKGAHIKEAAQIAAKYDEERHIKAMVQWDKDHNGGRKPHYIEEKN